MHGTTNPIHSRLSIRERASAFECCSWSELESQYASHSLENGGGTGCRESLSGVDRKLRTSPGLIGYSLEAQPLARKFWTLSVWSDQQSLMDFVARVPHSRVMQELAPHLGKSQFARWTVESQEIPPDWNSAKARITQS